MGTTAHVLSAIALSTPPPEIPPMADPIPAVTTADTTREPFWKQPAFWITLLLLPLVYLVVVAVLFMPGFTSEIKIMVITAIVGLLAAISGFWLASSYSSSKKDDVIASRAPSTTQIVTPSGNTTVNNKDST